MRFYVSDRLGPRRSFTPDGFLVCEATPIARTGQMLYAPHEVPVDPGTDGLVRVERTEDEVFSPRAIASFEGKAVTDGHPPVALTPKNWRMYAVGTVHNVRRGTGVQDDVLLADLLISDAATIDAVCKGKRHVSNGYDAEYEQLAPGYGRQHNIVGNHVALVDKGRCGPRCSIGDAQMTTEADRPAWYHRLKAAFASKDSAEFETAISGITSTEDDDSTHVHVHLPNNGTHDDGEAIVAGGEGDEEPSWFTRFCAAHEARMTKLETAVGKLTKDQDEEDDDEEEEEEKDDEEGDDPEYEKKKTGDAAIGVKTLIKAVLARAEILNPGIKMPTHDAKPTKKTFKAVCDLRRRALQGALTGDAAAVVTDLNGGKPPVLANMTCDAVRILFNASAERVKRSNNDGQRGTGQMGTRHQFGQGSGAPPTPAEINKRNREFWNKQAG